MSGDAYFRWWFISIVDKSSGAVIRANIDAVLSKTTSSAIEMAQDRNPRKPSESFSVSSATGRKKVDECRHINFVRTSQIQDFKTLMAE